MGARLALAFALLAVACGGTGGRPDAGPDGGPTCTPGPSDCPAAQPAAGAACPRDTLTCEYGSDPREGCRITATCHAAGGWALADPKCGALAACPATLPDPCATGAQCQASGGGLCDCQC